MLLERGLFCGSSAAHLFWVSLKAMGWASLGVARSNFEIK